VGSAVGSAVGAWAMATARINIITSTDRAKFMFLVTALLSDIEGKVRGNDWR
jgi:hypothetical protein